MLSFRTASVTNVPGHTASSTCCLLRSCPGYSSSNLRTANAFGRRVIARASSQRHSFLRSRRNRPKLISEAMHGRRPFDRHLVFSWIASITSRLQLFYLGFKTPYLRRDIGHNRAGLTTETPPQHHHHLMTEAQYAPYSACIQGSAEASAYWPRTKKKKEGISM